MPVLSYTHDEPVSRNGKPVFKIQVPNTYFTGKRKGVPFFEGVGRTESPRRAKFFAETMGYDVILPTGYKGKFDFASADVVKHEDDMDEFIVDEDPEDDDYTEDEEDD